MRKKLFIRTHGCQMNEYDSSRMLGISGIKTMTVLVQVWMQICWMDIILLLLEQRIQ